MKAAYLTGHGGVEKFQYGDVPDPAAGPDEVVVDIHAASVNAADYKVRLGSYDSKIKFPYILGRDFSGVVASRGAEVTDLAVGDAVFGVCDAGIEGAYAEKIAAPPGIPPLRFNLSHTDGLAACAVTLGRASSHATASPNGRMMIVLSPETQAVNQTICSSSALKAICGR
jgi:NADPH:quinone reductase-like Zn-dependent oxidoreductase